MANGSGNSGTTPSNQSSAPPLEAYEQDSRDDEARDRRRMADVSEQAIAAALLIGGKSELDKCGRLQAHHFVNRQPQLIFGAARRLASKGGDFGWAHIAVELADSDQLKECGGEAYLLDEVTKAPIGRVLASDVRQVFDMWRMREQSKVAAVIVDHVEADKPVDEWIEKLNEIRDAEPLDGDWMEILGPDDDDAELLEDEYAIDGLLPAEGVSVVTAATSSGKSSLALVVAAHIAAGRSEFAGRGIYTSDQTVVYVAPEGSRKTLNGRLKVIYAEHEFSDFEQRECKANIKMMVKPRSRLNDGLARWLVTKLAGEPVGLVVMDGLNKLGGATNENDNSEMVKVMDALESVATEFECPVWVNHHTAKDHQKGNGKNVGRGASAVEDAADVVARIEHDVDSGNRTFTITKGRDIGLPPHQLEYGIVGRRYGLSRRGRSITYAAATDFKWVQRQKKSIGEAKAEAMVQELLEAVGGDELHTKDLTERGFDRRKLGNLRDRYPKLLEQSGLCYRKNGTGGYWSISERD